MNCGTNFVKYLLFIFNFVFSLCGLALLISGVLRLLKVKDVAPVIEGAASAPAILVIIVGAIIFTIAFFGCCGAIRESHCMIVTFAMCLLTILIIQVAIAIYSFVQVQKLGPEAVEKEVKNTYEDYWANKRGSRTLVDTVQSSLECCGVNSYKDFFTTYNENNRVPWSCCAHKSADDRNDCTGDYYQKGCAKLILEELEYSGKLLGGIAIGVAAVELFGIIFALCLANSIKNSERRGYRV